MSQASTVTALNDHLPNVVVRLPLKYPSTNKVLKSHEFFESQIASSGRLVETANHMVDHISWRLNNDMRTITLTPVSIKNPFQLQFRTISLLLPSKVYPHCIDAIYHIEEGGYFVLDLIDENYLWITLRIETNDFLNDTKNFRSLTLDQFESWGHISVPYSFELRSNPYFLRTLDRFNVMVSLKDGGLLHLQRSSVLSDFNVFNCEENVHFHLGGVLDGIFKSGKADVTVDGVSSNAAIDAIRVPDPSTTLIATLTVNKTIKFWDLKEHSLLRERTISPQDTNTWLSFGPARYLKCSSNVLSVHSLLQTKHSISIHFWDTSPLKEGQKSYNILHTVELPSPTINGAPQESTFSNDIWFIQDFLYFGSELTVLWKSNNSSILTSYDMRSLPESNIPRKLSQWTLSGSETVALTTSFQHTEFFENQIFNTGKYNTLILRTAMNVLREHANLDIVYGGRAMRQLIYETVDTISAMEGVDKKATWLKLISLCDQFRKTGQESLSLAACTGKFDSIALQVDALSLFGDPHVFQVFSDSPKDSEQGKLATILSSLAQKFSNKSRFKIYQALLQRGQISSSSTTELYEEFIQSKVDDTEAIDFQNRLAEISLKTIREMIFSKTREDTVRRSASDSIVSPFVRLVAISSLRDIKDAHENILMDMAMVFLLFDPRQETVELLNAIVKRLSAYSVLEHIFCTCFNDQGTELESHGLSKPENSVFWISVADKFPALKQLINEGDMAEAFDYLVDKLEKCYDEIILNVVIELLNRGNGEAVKKNYFKSLNLHRLIDRILIGLVYLLTDDVEKFCTTFEDFAETLLLQTEQHKTDAPLEDRLNYKKEVSDLLNAVFASSPKPAAQKANYYHALFALAKSQAKVLRHRSHENIITPNAPNSTSSSETKFIKAALLFEQKAISYLKQVDPEQLNFNLAEAYLNVYELGLFLQNYQSVYESLQNLSPVADEYDYNYLMKRYLSTLISQGSISTIFPPNDNKLYRDNYLLIDSVLLDLANNELVLASALTFYEYLYSWRLLGSSTKVDPTELADKRGAAEALYMFITRFKLEQPDLLSSTSDQSEDIKQYKLKVLELYLIILNCLQSFESTEDQWLVKLQNNDSLAVVKLNEITLEYYNWLKEIKDEL